MTEVRHEIENLRTLYSQLVKERFHAMVASTPFRTARNKWMRHQHRRKPHPSVDSWTAVGEAWGREHPEEWESLQVDVAWLSEAYGIAQWHVLWAIVVEKYDPTDRASFGYLYALDVWSPEARLICHQPGPDLLGRLTQMGPEIGVYVEIHPADDRHEDLPLDDLRRFRLGLEFPVEYPADLAVADLRRAVRGARAMLRAVGVKAPQRGRGPSALKVYLVTHTGHPEFVKRLDTACRAVGFDLRVELGKPSASALDDPDKTPLALVRLKLSINLDAPVREMQRGLRHAIRQSRQLAKEAGLPLGQRLRHSPMAELVEELRVDGSRLDRRGLGDLVEDSHDIQPRIEGEPNPDAKDLIAKAKSRRHLVKKRLSRKGFLPP